MRTSVHKAKPQHDVLYQELAAIVTKFTKPNDPENDITSQDVLCIVANMLGKVIAMQDQRTMTPAMVMELVQSNIEEGNRQAVAELQQSRGLA